GQTRSVPQWLVAFSVWGFWVRMPPTLSCRNAVSLKKLRLWCGAVESELSLGLYVVGSFCHQRRAKQRPKD
ncbi:hypothetical protein PoB_005779600, partial [Plakobranchus ocellatus]